MQTSAFQDDYLRCIFFFFFFLFFKKETSLSHRKKMPVVLEKKKMHLPMSAHVFLIGGKVILFLAICSTY